MYSARQRSYPTRGKRNVELTNQPLPRYRLIGHFYAPLALPRIEPLTRTVLLHMYYLFYHNYIGVCAEKITLVHKMRRHFI